MSAPIRPGTDSGASYTPDTAMPPKPEKSSMFEDFIDIFYAPSKVFARRINSGWFMTFLIVSIVGGLFMFTSRSLTQAAADADFPRIEAKMRQNPQVTDDMVASARKRSQPGMTQYVATPALILMVAVLVLAFARIVSAKISYSQAAMITSLAFIPRLVQGLARTVEALMVDPTTVVGSLHLTHSPARFMPADASFMNLILASRFDVFVIWTTVLIGIGVAVMGNVSRTRGFVAATLVWVVATLPMLGFAAMMG